MSDKDGPKTLEEERFRARSHMFWAIGSLLVAGYFIARVFAYHSAGESYSLEALVASVMLLNYLIQWVGLRMSLRAIERMESDRAEEATEG